jgi:hypothetical protein
VLDEPSGYDEPASLPPPVITKPMPLRLHLEETEDEDADQKRLQTIFRLLQERPGADPVYLAIRTRDGETFDLQLPSASMDEGLKASLEELVSQPMAVA